jgi:enterochelin esterase-like enzyme
MVPLVIAFDKKTVENRKTIAEQVTIHPEVIQEIIPALQQKEQTYARVQD